MESRRLFSTRCCGTTSGGRPETRRSWSCRGNSFAGAESMSMSMSDVSGSDLERWEDVIPGNRFFCVSDDSRKTFFSFRYFNWWEVSFTTPFFWQNKSNHVQREFWGVPKFKFETSSCWLRKAAGRYLDVAGISKRVITPIYPVISI